MKKIIYSLLSLILVIGFSHKTWGQTPPSPNASSIGKYSGSNVSLYTGTPGIGIPLWTISGKNVSMPIGLSYQASGIRVEEIASWVGLGWTLNAGGVITRTVRGFPDEVRYFGHIDSGPLPTKTEIDNLPTLLDPNHSAGDGHTHKEDVLSDYVNGYKDSEPDIFYYNFLGRGGKFVFTKKSSGEFEVVSIPQSKIKFNYTRNISTGEFESWTLIDENGYQYKYESIESLEAISESYSNESFSWYLTEVKPPIGDESLVITYDEYNLDYQLRNSIERTLTDKDDPTNFENGYEKLDETHFTEFKSRDAKRISKIELKKGVNILQTVEFIPGTVERCDLLKDFPLNEIKITNMAGNLVKRYVFDYSYFTSYGQQDLNASCGDQKDSEGNAIDKRLKLNKITPFTGDNASIETRPYTFVYNGPDLPDRFSFYQDHWGYYNRNFTPGFYDDYDQNTLIPKLDNVVKPYYSSNPSPQIPANTVMTFGGAFRGVTPSSALAGSLKRINYPSGANTTYIFESHEIEPFSIGNYTFSETYVGGLRVQKIISNDGFDFHNDLITEFEYKSSDENNAPPSTYLIQTPNYGYWQYEGYEENDIQQFKVFSYTNLPLYYTQGSTLGYSRVVERKINENGETGMGEVVYEFNSPFEIEDVKGYPVGLTAPPVDSQDWKRGIMKRKVAFKINDDGSKQELSELDNSEIKYYGSYSEKGDDTSREKTILGMSFTPKNNQQTLSNGNTHYKVINEPIWYNTTTGSIEQVSTSVTVYNNEGSESSAFTKTTTNYQYDPNYMLLKSTKTVDSEPSKKYVTQYNYYPNILDPMELVDELKDKNILSLVSDSYTYIDNSGEILEGNRSKTILTAHNEPFSSQLLLPYQTEYSATGLADDFEVQKTFKYDSDNNLIEATQREGITSTTILDADGLFTLASISNAMHEEVAYTSFEYDNDNSWTYSGGTFEQEGITGKRSYKASGSTLNITKAITSDNDYIVSFWAKGGTPTVPLATSINALATIGSWSLYEGNLSLTSGQTLSVDVPSNIQIDELRLLPKGALMSTNAYDLSKGVISTCNANHIIGYYEYDSKNRVKYIKDYEGNILKSFDYSEQIIDLDFTAVPFNDGNQYVNNKIQLTASSACTGVSYEWFIDNATYTGEVIDHTFTSSGRHSVKLRATCNDYVTTSVEKEILVWGVATSDSWFTANLGLSGNFKCDFNDTFTINATTNLEEPFAGFYTYSWEYIENYTGPTSSVTYPISSTSSSITFSDLAAVFNPSNWPTGSSYSSGYIKCIISDVYGNSQTVNIDRTEQTSSPMITCTNCSVSNCSGTSLSSAGISIATRLQASIVWYVEDNMGVKTQISSGQQFTSFTADDKDVKVYYEYYNDCGKKITGESSLNIIKLPNTSCD